MSANAIKILTNIGFEDAWKKDRILRVVKAPTGPDEVSEAKAADFLKRKLAEEYDPQVEAKKAADAAKAAAKAAEDAAKAAAEMAAKAGAAAQPDDKGKK